MPCPPRPLRLGRCVVSEIGRTDATLDVSDPAHAGDRAQL
jgi:hypothetical protein